MPNLNVTVAQLIAFSLLTQRPRVQILECCQVNYCLEQWTAEAYIDQTLLVLSMGGFWSPGRTISDRTGTVNKRTGLRPKRTDRSNERNGLRPKQTDRSNEQNSLRPKQTDRSNEWNGSEPKKNRPHLSRTG